MLRLWRYLWAAPWSLLGLVAGLLLICGGATLRHRTGTVEIGGGTLAAWLQRHQLLHGFAAITLGHVILGLNHTALDRLRTHERIHVQQYERWGILFVPAYLLSSLWQWLRGRHPYRCNHFEREACAHERQ